MLFGQDTRTPMYESFRFIDNMKEGTKPRKIANNTYEYTDVMGYRHIRLHQTNVVTFLPDEPHLCEINFGDYYTKTTRARIWDHAKVQCFQKKGTVYVVTPHGPVEYHEHMLVDSRTGIPVKVTNRVAQAKREADVMLKHRAALLALQTP